MVRKGIIVGIVVAVGAIVALIGTVAVMAPINTKPTTNNQQQVAENTINISDVPTETFFSININSTGSWSGVVQGSDFTQKSIQGTGDDAQVVKCEPGGIYSAVIQSQGTGQKSTVSAVRNTMPATSYLDQLRDSGHKDQITADLFRQVRDANPPVILKQETTTADYGVVSISGTC